MKKILYALCAMMMLAMTACHRDDNNPQGPANGGGTPQPDPIPTGEGIFNPDQKIETIAIDGQTSEQWVWTNGKLMMVENADGATSFEYNGWRVSEMTTILEGTPVDVEYAYDDNNKLATVDAYSGNMHAIGIVFNHNNAAGKISDMSLNINSTLLGLLSELIGNGGIPGFTKGMSKFSIENTDFNAHLTWEGDNVKRMILDGTVSINTTIDEASNLLSMMNIDSLGSFNLDSIISTFSFLLTDSNLLVTVQLADTTDYTYDSQNNPFYGYLGALDVTTFSANNAKTMRSSGTANISITAHTWLGNQAIPLPAYSIGSRSETYTYTYNNANFPLTVTVTDSDNASSVKQYTYKQ
ncbi:MAG: hypothetical protein J6X79_04170 [Bacteroidales bacterium]|nr:hypothetical protein [Bacteroidales bacterium]